MVLILLLTMFAGEPSKDFRVSAVQENQVWIEGGLLDGLQEGVEGEIFYEITIAGQKKRIVPSKVRLSKVDDRQSIGILKDQTGIINIGYHAAIAPKPASELLLTFHTRGAEAIATKDYNLAKQYYQRILEALPGDPFAIQKIRDIDVELEKLAALQRERRNVPYYKEAIRTSLRAGNEDSARLAKAYVDKIAAVMPTDSDLPGFREEITRIESAVAVAQRSQRTAEVAEKAAEKTARAAAAAIPEETKERGRETGVTSQKTTEAAEKAAEKTPATAVAVVYEKPSEKPKEEANILPPPLLKDVILIPESDVKIGAEPGKSPFANETPRHSAHVGAFYIDKCEVTNEDYKRFCDATGRIYPGYFVNGNYPEGAARRPVVMISWIDADAYARWAGKRLPTEREWEAAAAGPSGRTWPWGDLWDPTLANTREGGMTETADVGSHPADASVFGVLDMAGNVSEWTADWYQPYPGNTRREKEYGEQFKVLRGGSVQVSKGFTRCQFRARLPDGFRSMDLGFRCAMSARDVKQ